MTWRTYPEYKYSGIEWLGDIPAHWETKKLFYCFKQIGSGTTPNTENELYYRDGIIPWITTSELREKIITESSEKVSQKAVQDHSSLKIYPKDNRGESAACERQCSGASIRTLWLINKIKLPFRKVCKAAQRRAISPAIGNRGNINEKISPYKNCWNSRSAYRHGGYRI